MRKKSFYCSVSSISDISHYHAHIKICDLMNVGEHPYIFKYFETLFFYFVNVLARRDDT